ncbi:MAG: tyrosine-type recombinase/integrase [bacterium]|nr:tyrosine-type recombinase/integrase [bacterium]
MNDFIDDLEQWMRRSGFRQSTIRRTLQDTTQLLTWLREGKDPPRRLRASVRRLEFYFDDLDVEPMSWLRKGMDAVLAAPPPKTPLERRRARQGRKKRQQKSYADKDWKRLWVAIREDDSTPARVIELMVVTGLRVGDLLRLSRRRLRDGLDRNVITIEQKGGDDRLIYTEGTRWPWKRLYSAFEGVHASTVAWLVAPNGDGSPLSSDAAYMAVNRRLKKLGKDLGIPGPHRTHRIRRTVAVQALRLTEDLPAVQQLLGHKSINTTLGYVSEARPEREAELRKQLGQMFRSEDE